MPDDLNPTPDKIDEAIKKTEAEIAAQENEETPPAPTEEATEEPIESDESKEAAAGEEAPEETPTEEASEEPSQPDYKKKFTASQREALVLLAKTKQYEKVSEVTEPTEEELQLEFPEWEEMSVTERTLAKKTVWNDRRFAIIDQVNKESKNVEEWNEKVDTFVTDPKVLNAHPELEGKTDDFKIFATKPTRRGVELEDLVLAFNGELANNKPAPKKGQMFEQGSAGLNDRGKPKDDKISTDEAAVLMTTDYKKYKEYLIAGKIADPA